MIGAANDVPLSFSVGDYVWTKPIAGSPKLARIGDARPLPTGVWMGRIRLREAWSAPILFKIDRALSPHEVADNRKLGLIPPAGEQLVTEPECQQRGFNCSGAAYSSSRFCVNCMTDLPPDLLRTSELMLLCARLVQIHCSRQHADVLRERAELLAKETRPTAWDEGLEQEVQTEQRLLRRIGEVRL